MKLPEALPKLEIDPNKIMQWIKKGVKDVKGIGIEIRWHLLKD